MIIILFIASGPYEPAKEHATNVNYILPVYRNINQTSVSLVCLPSMVSMGALLTILVSCIHDNLLHSTCMHYIHDVRKGPTFHVSFDQYFDGTHGHSQLHTPPFLAAHTFLIELPLSEQSNCRGLGACNQSNESMHAYELCVC